MAITKGMREKRMYFLSSFVSKFVGIHIIKIGGCKMRRVGICGIMLYLLFYLHSYSQSCPAGQIPQKDPVTQQVTCVKCQSGVIINGICLGGGGNPAGAPQTTGDALESAGYAKDRADSALKHCPADKAPDTRKEVEKAKEEVEKKEGELKDQQKKCDNAKMAADDCHKLKVSNPNIDCTEVDQQKEKECGEKLEKAIKALNEAVANLNKQIAALEKACGLLPSGRGGSCVISKPSISNRNNQPHDYLFLFATIGLLVVGILFSLARYYKRVAN